MSFKGKIFKGVFWSIVEIWGARLISIIIFALLARLLEPNDFGLIALASIYIDFLELFIRQGFSEAIIQREDLEPKHLSTAFCISVVTSLFLTLTTILGADLVAFIFDEKSLQTLVKWASISFIFSGLSNVQKGIFVRNLEFKQLAIRSLASSLVGGFFGVVCAMSGFGLWSLLVKILVQSFTNSLLILNLSSWKPSLEFSAKHFKDLFEYSSNALGVLILNYFYRRFDDILIGFYLGSVSLGLYAVAYKLLRILIQVLVGVLDKVTLPMFSRVQSDPRKIAQYLYKSIGISSIISIPLFLSVAVLSTQIILITFGEQWIESAPIMQVLSLSGCVYSLKTFNTNVIKALGKPRWILFLRLIESCAICIAFLMTVKYGLIAVAIAFTVINFIFAPLTVYLVKRLLNISLKPYIKTFIYPLCCSLLTAFILMIYNQILGEKMNIYISFFSSIFIGLLIYVPLILFSSSELIMPEIQAIKSRFSKR